MYVNKLWLFLFLLSISFQLANAQGNCQPSASSIALDVNNVRATLPHAGNLWSNGLTAPGYEVPKGNPTAVHSLFAGGLWIGGIDGGGTLRMAAQTYRQVGNDFWPGPLNANVSVSQSECSQYDRHWKVNIADIRSFINYYRSTSLPVNPNLIPPSILEWPAKGNSYAVGANMTFLNLIGRDLAPFVDVDGNGVYDPTMGDYPDIKGDQHVFWVFNDKGNTHTETGGQPLGIEVQANAYAFNTNNVLNDITFYSFRILHKDIAILDSCYIGIWVDGDLGCNDNDYVGCDTSRDIGIMYNAEPTDPDCASQGYGSNPPIVGLKILRGPTADFLNGVDDDRDGFIDEELDSIDNDGDNEVDEWDEIERMRMSSFRYYNNDFTVTGNPESAMHFYYYLSGRWKDGSPMTYGNDGYGGANPTSFMFPDSPSDPTGWSECSINSMPGDRRFLVSIGPLTLDPGEVQTVDFAVLWTRPTGFDCGDFNSTIGAVGDQVQVFYDTLAGFIQQRLDSIPDMTNALSRKQKSRFQAHPNPFNDQINIQTNHLEHSKSIQLCLIDVTGKQIRRVNTHPQDNRFLLETDEVQPGLYYLVMLKDGKALEVKKLIKVSY